MKTWSVGDYILSGGELAAMTMIDVTTRLIPGALGHEGVRTPGLTEFGLTEIPSVHKARELCGTRCTGSIIKRQSPGDRALAFEAIIRQDMVTTTRPFDEKIVWISFNSIY